MSEITPNCVMFAGPTLHGVERFATAPTYGIRVLPPVRRGDIEAIVSAYPPGVIAIVDGLFQQCLSVGHAEIRDAVSGGWTVWGLSSMGAIRAYEMRHLGVRGYGRVYEYFFKHDDFRDDEIALIHRPEPPYHALTEPLVHIRFFLGELLKSCVLTKKHESAILDDLTSMWFGDRTLSLVRSMILGLIPQHEATVDAMLANFDRFRLKCHDLSDFLREQPWKTHQARVTAGNQCAASVLRLVDQTEGRRIGEQS
jgi:hypothetical protein